MTTAFHPCPLTGWYSLCCSAVLFGVVTWVGLNTASWNGVNAARRSCEEFEDGSTGGSCPQTENTCRRNYGVRAGDPEGH